MGEATGQQRATAYGAIDSFITSSGGDDQIVFKSKATADGTVEAYGMFDSQIDSSDGNDTITVLDESGYLDIGGNTIIDGGGGDDLIDAGIGSGKILGGDGSGVDTLVADFFTTEGLTFEFIDGSQDILGLDGDGLRVTGSRTKSGESVAWTQEIFQIEQFQIGGELVSTSDVLARFVSA